MSVELKRVPLSFDWPLKTIWYGYSLSYCNPDLEFGGGGYSEGGCENCRKFAELKNIIITDSGCPDFDTYLGPPKGEGFQLWETVSEGAPVSPVFETLEALCFWCEDNATTFGSSKASKEQWAIMLQADFVYDKQGNTLFI